MKKKTFWFHGDFKLNVTIFFLNIITPLQTLSGQKLQISMIFHFLCQQAGLI